jgi:ketosteroid isomerase-like protein
MKSFCCMVFGLLSLALQAQTPPTTPVFPKIKIANDSATVAALKEINRDVWGPFAAAYAAGDAEKYLALHTPDFIRATVEDVHGFEGALANAQLHFRWNRDNGRRCEIAFAFFERVVGAGLASERGIYRYTSIAKDGARQDYFGKFHVFHRKMDRKWKITVDYDSDEDATIGEADFKAGLPPDVFVTPEK